MTSKPEVRKRPSVYAATLTDERLKAAHRQRAAWQAYVRLTDKDTAYAQQIRALGELHDKVAAIWFQAPDEVQPKEEAKDGTE